jgi:hypothetical protein
MGVGPAITFPARLGPTRLSSPQPRRCSGRNRAAFCSGSRCAKLSSGAPVSSFVAPRQREPLPFRRECRGSWGASGFEWLLRARPAAHVWKSAHSREIAAWFASFNLGAGLRTGSPPSTSVRAYGCGLTGLRRRGQCTVRAAGIPFAAHFLPLVGIISILGRRRSTEGVPQMRHSRKEIPTAHPGASRRKLMLARVPTISPRLPRDPRSAAVGATADRGDPLLASRTHCRPERILP